MVRKTAAGKLAVGVTDFGFCTIWDLGEPGHVE